MTANISHLLRIVALTLPLWSCGQREIIHLSETDADLTIAYSWELSPDADPDGMTLIFYPEGTAGQIWRFDIAGKEGGRVNLPMGRYRMLTFNNDVRNTDLTDSEHFSTAALTVRQAPSSSSVIMTPGKVYSGSVGPIDITPCGVTYPGPDGAIKECPKCLIRCAPEPRSATYTVIASVISDTRLIRSASATLDGLFPSVLLATGSLAGSPAAQNFLLAREDTTLTGSTISFFDPAPPEHAYTLAVTVTRTDSVSFRRTFDVTGQVAAAPDRHNIIIRVDSLQIPPGDIPDNPPEDVGIEVEIDGWQVVSIDISTNHPDPPGRKSNY